MKEQKRNKSKNKGFSLVELIVVMAIMAILVGAVAPQVIKYVEKARESRDLQLVNTAFTAVQTAITSSKETVPNITDQTLGTVISTYHEGATGVTCYIGDEIAKILGSDMDTDGEVRAKFKSSNATDSSASIYITYVASTGKITVSVKKSGALTTDLIGPVTN